MAAKNPYDHFLATLKSVRRARTLTQAEVAKRIKISRAQYTAIENGRSTVNFIHLYNLAVALGVKFVVGRSSSPEAIYLR